MAKIRTVHFPALIPALADGNHFLRFSLTEVGLDGPLSKWLVGTREERRQLDTIGQPMSFIVDGAPIRRCDLARCHSPRPHKVCHPLEQRAAQTGSMFAMMLRKAFSRHCTLAQCRSMTFRLKAKERH